jgi:hypothetical protein
MAALPLAVLPLVVLQLAAPPLVDLPLAALLLIGLPLIVLLQAVLPLIVRTRASLIPASVMPGNPTPVRESHAVRVQARVDAKAKAKARGKARARAKTGTRTSHRGNPKAIDPGLMVMLHGRLNRDARVDVVCHIAPDSKARTVARKPRIPMPRPPRMSDRP